MPAPRKYNRKEIYRLAFVEGYAPKVIAEELDVDHRQVRKMLRERAREVITPERPGRSKL